MSKARKREDKLIAELNDRCHPETISPEDTQRLVDSVLRRSLNGSSIAGSSIASSFGSSLVASSLNSSFAGSLAGGDGCLDGLGAGNNGSINSSLDRSVVSGSLLPGDRDDSEDQGRLGGGGGGGGKATAAVRGGGRVTPVRLFSKSPAGPSRVARSKKKKKRTTTTTRKQQQQQQQQLVTKKGNQAGAALGVTASSAQQPTTVQEEDDEDDEEHQDGLPASSVSPPPLRRIKRQGRAGGSCRRSSSSGAGAVLSLPAALPPPHPAIAVSPLLQKRHQRDGQRKDLTEQASSDAMSEGPKQQPSAAIATAPSGGANNNGKDAANPCLTPPRSRRVEDARTVGGPVEGC